MKKIPFTGSGVAIVTPFDKNGNPDFDKLRQLVEFHIENKTDAIIVCGTTGESAAMPDEEHLSVVDCVVKAAKGRIPIIAGTGSNDTKHGIELSKKAEALGVDGLLMVTPYYNKATQKGLIRHYTMMAEAVNVPIILYNVPSRTGVNITPETAYELSKIENIVAIKEASGNVSEILKISKLCGDNLYIYSGDDDIVVPAMAAGGIGVISVVANVMPKEVHDMCQAFLDGNAKESLEKQLYLYDLAKAMFVEVNPIPVKTAMNMMGMEVGGLRMPLCEMEEQNAEKLKNVLMQYGLVK